jgi:hypothetical protein
MKIPREPSAAIYILYHQVLLFYRTFIHKIPPINSMSSVEEHTGPYLAADVKVMLPLFFPPRVITVDPGG